MIKVNELRENNYYHFTGNSEGLWDFKDDVGRVKLNESFGFYVELTTFSNEVLSSFKEDQINPIPLTPEILEKCGFEKKVGTFANSKAVYFDIYDEHYRIYWSKGSISFHLNAGDCFPRLTGMDYLHLHQLQNLYYELTGEELNISF